MASTHSGEMPPVQYWIVHPGTRMDTQQKQELIKALETVIGDKTAFELGALR
ncbi:MAG TPA: hypothetical protein VF918_13530 [Anaerolineales bacterium]